MTADEQFADDLARALAAERVRERLAEDEGTARPLPEPWEPAPVRRKA